MGTFQAAFEIGDLQGQTWVTIEALVDTGSSYTWIPRQILERLDVRPQFQREFETADGRVVLRDMANTMVRWNGETMPTLVVFGGDNDAVLLGAYTLEGFALAPDPVNRRLVRVRGLAMGLERQRPAALSPGRLPEKPETGTLTKAPLRGRNFSARPARYRF